MAQAGVVDFGECFEGPPPPARLSVAFGSFFWRRRGS